MKEGILMLIIVGSRRDGNSLKLAKMVKSELEKERLSVEMIVPGNQKIHICTGCMDCDKNGVCDFTDDMKNNIEKIKKENTLMFITPTRWNLLSGDIKIFMDRLNPLYSSQGLKGKKMIAVSIGAKPKDVYSTEASTFSLRNFAEASGMDCVLSKNFDECRDANDVLLKSSETEEFLKEVKIIAQSN